MNISSLNLYNNVNFKNVGNFGVKKADSIGTSYKTSNVLSSLIQGQTPKSNIQYLSHDLNRKEIIDALNDKNKMGRSFFGYKRTIANIIIKAEDKKLAVDNFNILMNAKNKKINAYDIASLLYISTIINNKNDKMSEKFAEEYGFKGGLLDDKSIDSILKKIIETRKTNEIQNQIVQELLQEKTHFHNQTLMNQMIMQNQMQLDQMMQDQMMQDQMMHTPGMGFC